MIDIHTLGATLVTRDERFAQSPALRIDTCVP